MIKISPSGSCGFRLGHADLPVCRAGRHRQTAVHASTACFWSLSRSSEPVFPLGSMWVKTRSRAGLPLWVGPAGPGSFRSVKSDETRKKPFDTHSDFRIIYTSLFCSDRMEANRAILHRSFGITEGLMPFRNGTRPCATGVSNGRSISS